MQFYGYTVVRLCGMSVCTLPYNRKTSKPLNLITVKPQNTQP